MILLAGLTQCFLGYALFRIYLVAYAGIVGAILGQLLIAWLRPAPTQLDLFVAGTAGAVMLALGGWFLYRIYTGLAVGSAVGAAVAVLTWGWHPAATWTLAVLAAVVLGAAVMVFTRTIVVWLTAISGAASIGLVAWQLTIGSTEGHLPAWVPWAIAAAAAGLAGGGIVVQKRTLRVFSAVLSPEPKRGKGRYGPRSTKPPLAKI
jgi:hypothetical protein